DPAFDGDFAIARIDADEDTLRAERVARLLDQRGILEGDRAEDHAVDAHVQKVSHRVERSNAPTGLHRDVHSLDDGLEVFPILGATVERAVEVDDMDPLGAELGEAARHRDRILRKDRLLALLPLHQADTPSISK